MALTFGYLCFAFATIVAVGNLLGVGDAILRQQHGDRRGYSVVPFVSLACATAAYCLARNQIGWWVFLPVLGDPATWAVIALPCVLLWRDLRRRP